MFQGIITWVVANPQMAAAIGLAIYLFATKRLTFSGLIQEIIKDIQGIVSPTPAPSPTPSPGPTPAPVPNPAQTFLDQLIALLQQSRKAGNKDLEEATLKLLDTYQS
jgi:hypothetical protein